MEAEKKSFSITTKDDHDDHDDHKDSSEEQELSLSHEKLNIVVPKKKKLLVMNLNGFLLRKVHVNDKEALPKSRPVDYVALHSFLYKRPFSEEFIKFCLERFEVGIWSSAEEKNISAALKLAVGEESKNKLRFIWDRDQCREISTTLKPLESKENPIYFKELKKVWDDLKIGGPYSASNTLMIGDKPYKAYLNPVISKLIFIIYVKENAFGVPAITSSHPDWGFYSEVRSLLRSIE